jgi:hypothetical protein
VETHRDIEADVQIALPASTAAEGNYDIIHRDRFPDTLKTHFATPATIPGQLTVSPHPSTCWRS